MESRSKNGIRNIATGFINKIILILLPFIARTVLVRVLGGEYLGLNSLFTSVLTVLNLSELGFGSALVYSMYKPAANNDTLKLSALLALYKKIYNIVGIAIFIIGIALMPFLPYLIKGDCPSDVNLYILYVLFLLNTGGSYFLYAHKRALLIAFQRNDKINNINTIVSIFLYIIQICILLITRNYYGYVVVLVVSTIIENIWINLLTNKIYPEIKPAGLVPEIEKKAIKKHVVGIALQKLCSTSRDAFNNIAISMFIGLIPTAIYGNYHTIWIAIHGILYMIPNSIRSTVGNSVATETKEKNYQDFNAMFLLYGIINSVSTICLFCLFQPFMQLWMGEDMLFPLKTVALICLYFSVLQFGDIIALYKDAAGLWWYGRHRVIIEAISNTILVFTLGYFLGVDGMLIATISTLFFLGIVYGGYIVFRYYFTGIPFMPYILNLVLCVCVTALISGIIYWVCSLLPTEGLLNLICRLLICLLLGGSLVLLAVRLHPHYNNTLNFAKRILHGLK